LRALEGFPIEFDVEPFGGKKAFLVGNEIVQAHAFGGNFHAMQSRHGALRYSIFCGFLDENLVDIVCLIFVQGKG